MVRTKEDLTGRIFGRLLVIKQTEDYIDPNGKHHARWLCECSCGNPNGVNVVGKDLKSGHTTSCGCLQRERARELRMSQSEKNPVDLESKSYGIGYTIKGEEFWFDKEDYKIIEDYHWFYNKNGYVTAHAKESNQQIFLHNLIMGEIPNGMVVDHKRHPPKNQHKVDNRKNNLELKTLSQNQMNSSLYSNNTSGTTGVSWSKKSQKWVAYIQKDRKQIHLGFYTDKQDAIKARKEAEEKYFGRYSYDKNNS